jgi:hypothetical protein
MLNIENHDLPYEEVTVYTLRANIEQCMKKIDALRHDLQPLIDIAQAIPAATEANPMMKMLLGRMSK